MFAMLNSLSPLRAIGTWGGVANDSSPLATAWYNGMAAFLSTKIQITQASSSVKTDDVQAPQAVVRSNPLKGLPALNKIHYSWPFPFQAGECQNDGPHPGPGCVRYLNDSSSAYLDGFLHDYVRITGACPLDLGHAKELEVHTCAALCAASAKDPGRCIGLNFSPWYAEFPSSDPTITGAPEEAEVSENHEFCTTY